MNKFSFARVWTTVKNNFKINKSIPVLILIITAIILFLSTTLPVSSVENSYPVIDNINYERYSWYLESIKDCWDVILGINGIQTTCAVILAIGSAFLCAVSLTAFSRDRRGTDFWNSQSLTRQEHLTANLISGFLYYTAALIPTWFLSLFIAHVFTTVPPYSFGEIFIKSLPPLLFVLLFYACILAVAFLAVTVAGTVMSSIVIFGTLLGYPALMTVFAGFVSEDVFSTHLSDILSHNFMFYAYSSPVLRFFFSFYDAIYSIGTLDILLYVFCTAAIVALLFFLVKIKKSELSQEAVVFPILRYPLQYLWTFFFTLFISWFLYAVNRSALWFVIGAVIGLIVSFMVLNMIFEKSFSGIFKKSSHLLISGAVFIVLLLVFVADIFSMYKQPTPDLDEIVNFNVNVNSDRVREDDRTEWSWRDIYYDEKTDGEIGERDREALAYVYNYLAETGYNYKSESEGRVWYSVSITFWCENDPSPWRAHASFYDPDSEFLSVIEYLSERFSGYVDTNTEEVKVKVDYSEKDADFYEEIIIDDVGIIGGADGPTEIIVS